jgi:pimeloyl-ACP methyl ester carboxylesterase
VTAPPTAVRLVTEDGVTLVADFYPAAQPADLAVVVCHGFTLSARSAAVRRIATQIVGGGIPVLALDFRGHGRSGGLGTAGDLEVHDVAAAVAWLREQGFARVAALGWSMGGSAVLRYAGLGGDVDAVVSVSSPGAWFERGTRSMRVVHWVCETRSGRLAVRVLRRTRLSAQGWPVVPESPSEVVGRIAPTPLLIVHGDADHYFPMRHVDLLAAAAPTASLWIEPGMGHAETATTPQLLERIVGWVRDVVGSEPVCDDGVRD